MTKKGGEIEIASVGLSTKMIGIENAVAVEVAAENAPERKRVRKGKGNCALVGSSMHPSAI